jgi:phosphoribosyl 1,2-cyclic phosphodiesterase
MMPSPSLQTKAPVITFWGVRGSLPVPGPATVVYGGNTTCLEIEMPSPDGPRRLIVDAGSGLLPLGRSRDWTGVKRLDLLLTHLHHDHVIGLPFFNAMFETTMAIHIWCGNLGGESAGAALRRMFSPPLFPVTLEKFPAKLEFHGFSAGATLDIDGISIRTAPLEHPSGATGYRFDGEDGSLAVVTDIEHRSSGPDPAVVALCLGVDTLVYDSMVAEGDYSRCQGWGHSTTAAAIALAKKAGVRQLVGFHHAPEHDDTIMADRERHLRAAWPNGLMARENMRLICGPAQ